MADKTKGLRYVYYFQNDSHNSYLTTGMLVKKEDIDGANERLEREYSNKKVDHVSIIHGLQSYLSESVNKELVEEVRTLLEQKYSNKKVDHVSIIHGSKSYLFGNSLLTIPIGIEAERDMTSPKFIFSAPRIRDLERATRRLGLPFQKDKICFGFRPHKY